MSTKFEEFLKLELTPGAKLVALAAIRRGPGNHRIHDLCVDVNILVSEVNMVQIELRQAGINNEKKSFDFIGIAADNPFLGMLETDALTVIVNPAPIKKKPGRPKKTTEAQI